MTEKKIETQGRAKAHIAEDTDGMCMALDNPGTFHCWTIGSYDGQPKLSCCFCGRWE